MVIGVLDMVSGVRGRVIVSRPRTGRGRCQSWRDRSQEVCVSSRRCYGTCSASSSILSDTGLVCCRRTRRLIFRRVMCTLNPDIQSMGLCMAASSSRCRCFSCRRSMLSPVSLGLVLGGRHDDCKPGSTNGNDAGKRLNKKGGRPPLSSQDRCSKDESGKGSGGRKA